jgi:LysM repeat protein
VERSRVTHWVAPIAFLAAITIGALFIRAGFEQGKHNHAQTQTTTVTTKKKKHGHGRPQHVARRYYTIQTGDTLAAIAVKSGTTVTRLIQLNPGINPTALRVGQRIRVQ